MSGKRANASGKRANVGEREWEEGEREWKEGEREWKEGERGRTRVERRKRWNASGAVGVEKATLSATVMEASRQMTISKL